MSTPFSRAAFLCGLGALLVLAGSLFTESGQAQQPQPPSTLPGVVPPPGVTQPPVGASVPPTGAPQPPNVPPQPPTVGPQPPGPIPPLVPSQPPGAPPPAFTDPYQQWMYLNAPGRPGNTTGPSGQPQPGGLQPPGGGPSSAPGGAPSYSPPSGGKNTP